MAFKNNTYNPPDACVQLSVIDSSKDLKHVPLINNSLAIRYVAMRNDTSSHHKMVRVTVDETETVLFVPRGADETNTTRLGMIGRVARLYAYPLTNVGTHDDHPVEFGVVYSTKDYLVLHSCISDDTHGHFDAVLVLSREKDNRAGLDVVLKEVYKELPYVTEKMLMVERNKHCKD